MTAPAVSGSIARRVARNLAAITVGSLLAVTAGLLGYETLSFRREMLRHAALLADLVGAECVTPLAFGDADAASETLASLRSDDQVLRACLYGMDGAPFARFGRQAAAPGCPALAEDGGRFETRRLHSQARSRSTGSA
jgi:hypothetical protein